MKSKSISQIYDDRSLSFSEIREICTRAMRGKLDTFVENITEKTDGQNVMVTVKDGKVELALGAGMIITDEDIERRYEKSPNIKESYQNVKSDMKKAIAKLSETIRSQLFQNGKYFLNLEIINPNTRNIIYYGEQKVLQIHNIVESENGARKIVNHPESRIIEKIVEAFGNDSSYNFEFRIPRKITFERVGSASRNNLIIKAFERRLDKKLNRLSLTERSTINDYYRESFKLIINKEFPMLSHESKLHLTKRWAENDKSFRISKSAIKEHHLVKRLKEFDSKARKLSNMLKNELRNLVILSGVWAMKIVENPLCQNTITSIRLLEEDMVEFTKLSDILEKNEHRRAEILYYKKLYLELGGMSNYSPIEGVVFEYKQKQYKLTGMYTPINQILALMKHPE